jgi:hypothetical protein
MALKSNLDDLAAREAKMKGVVVDPQKTEPKVDVKVEPKIEPKVDPKVAPEGAPSGTPQTEPKIEPKIDSKVEFNWEELSKKTGREFKSIDDISSLIKKIGDYELSQSEITKVKKELEEKEKLLGTLVDPMQYFDGEEEYKIQQALKKIESKDRKGVAKQLFHASEIDDFSVLRLKEFYDNPNAKDSDATVRKYLEKKYGVLDVPREEWDESVLYAIKADANKVRESFARMLDEIKPLDKIDLNNAKKTKEEQEANTKKEIEAAWDGYAPNIQSDFKEIPLQIEGEKDPYFVIKVDDEFRKKLPVLVKTYAVQRQMPLTRENVNEILNLFAEQYYLNNRHSINKAMVEDEKAKWIIERDKEDHNPKEPKRQDGDVKIEIDPQLQYMREATSRKKISL